MSADTTKAEKGIVFTDAATAATAAVQQNPLPQTAAVNLPTAVCEPTAKPLPTAEIPCDNIGTAEVGAENTTQTEIFTSVTSEVCTECEAALAVFASPEAAAVTPMQIPHAVDSFLPAENSASPIGDRAVFETSAENAAANTASAQSGAAARRPAPAGFFVRVCAAALDELLLLPLWAAFLLLFGRCAREIWQLVLCLVLVRKLYSVLCLYIFSRTLGKALLRLFVSTKEGARLTFWQALLRETAGKLLSAAPVFAGFLMGAGKRKLMLHDRLFDTAVFSL